MAPHPALSPRCCAGNVNGAGRGIKGVASSTRCENPCTGSGVLRKSHLNSAGVRVVTIGVIKQAVVLLAWLGGAAVPVAARLPPEQLQKLPPAASERVDFVRDIKPIFEASCVKCHG